ncbi:MAG: hypothetical protein DI569_12940 [Sphingopyxis macrogoltabida]|uniref:Phage tail protein n=1 Tax=Sphingopyxis macrogoltabida TaxID=33050 RepID=A0A2W5KYT4_SPHMC|nr:MAG: hypothetical protein DI569_12940 [Sphingopyxis macrogoltabida]
MSIILTVTTAGRAALVNAEGTGTDPVEIAEVGFTEAAFVPAPSQTALPGEFKRVDALGGTVLAPDMIHVLARDETADEYALRGFALYLEDGTLFAIYGQASPILNKTPATPTMLALDIKFEDIDAALVTFGDTNFILPPATETVQGIAELATQAEANAGTDDERIVTPKKGKAALLPWLLAQDGAGSGIDADLLDGKEGAEYALLASPTFTGDPRAPHAAQFDNDTSLATTAFVQRALGNMRGVIQINEGGAIAYHEAGSVVILGGGGESTVTLPSGATLPDGAAFHFFCQGATWTIERAGADVIAVGTASGGSAVTSVTISGSDFCTITWRAAGAWVVTNGTPLLAIGGGIMSTKAPVPTLEAGVGQWVPPIVDGTGIYVPAGGTWAYSIYNNGQGYTGIAAGGTRVFTPGTLNWAFGFCWRMA